MFKLKATAAAAALGALISAGSASAKTVDIEDLYGGMGEGAYTEILGMEWLRWDLTTGLSIKDATKAYKKDGWRLAGNSEMSSLFNHAGLHLRPDEDYTWLDEIPFTADENVGQARQSITDSLKGSGFIASHLGITSPYSCAPDETLYSLYGCTQQSVALFGDDADGDGLYNMAAVYHGDFPGTWSTYSSAHLSADEFDRHWSNATTTARWPEGVTWASGVALVRDVTPVPIPASLPLLAAALAALGVWRRKARR